MRFLKIFALFVCGSIGLFIGDRIGPVPDIFDWEMGLEYGVASIVREKHYFLMGVSVSALVLLCSRALRFHDIAVLTTVFFFSFLYTVADLLRNGETLGAHWFLRIWDYQAPYFVGFLVVMGVAYNIEKWVRPLVRKRGG